MIKKEVENCTDNCVEKTVVTIEGEGIELVTEDLNLAINVLNSLKPQPIEVKRVIPQVSQRPKKKSNGRKKYAKPVPWTEGELRFVLTHKDKGTSWLLKSFVGERHTREQITMVLWRVNNNKELSKLMKKVAKELGIL